VRNRLLADVGRFAESDRGVHGRPDGARLEEDLLGGPDEAAGYAQVFGDAWRATPGALEWLMRAGIAQARRPPKGRRGLGAAVSGPAAVAPKRSPRAKLRPNSFQIKRLPAFVGAVTGH